MTTKATNGKGKLQANSWMGQIIQGLLVVITTWQLFAKEIHGYIDVRMDTMQREVVRDVAIIGQGQMLILKDSIFSNMRTYQDATDVRLSRIELQGDQPNVNRTIIHAADTAGLQQLNERMHMIEHGVEAILDGVNNVPWRRQPAHNERAKP